MWGKSKVDSIDEDLMQRESVDIFVEYRQWKRKNENAVKLKQELFQFRSYQQGV